MAPKSIPPRPSDLLSKIAAAASRLGIAESTLCMRAANDGKIAGRLRAGRSVWTGTADKIERWIAENVA